MAIGASRANSHYPQLWRSRGQAEVPTSRPEEEVQTIGTTRCLAGKDLDFAKVLSGAFHIAMESIVSAKRRIRPQDSRFQFRVVPSIETSNSMETSKRRILSGGDYSIIFMGG